jgi:hypothetical protein
VSSLLSSVHLVAMQEHSRMARSGRAFSLLRFAPSGWKALDKEVEVLSRLISAHLRRSDFVGRVRDREVGAVLLETAQVETPAARVRAVLARELPELEVRIGWAVVRPDQQRTWQEAWRWAGQLQVADAVASKVAA